MRCGFSLAELIAALATASLLGAAVTATIIAQLRIATAIGHAALVAEGFVQAPAVLSAEMRDGSRSDLVALTDDSIALRAFRATAVVCDTSAFGAVTRWAGYRLPEPAKDSVIILRGGDEMAAAITSAATTGSASCTARSDERLVSIATSSRLLPGDILLAFERGAYHLSGGALRWRTGSAGRQPLTAEIFDDHASGFGFAGAPTLTVRSRAPHPRFHPVELTMTLRSLEPDTIR